MPRFGGLFRSEPMCYVRLAIPIDATHDILWKLGELGYMHVIDLNDPSKVALPSDISLKSRKRILACSQLETRLDFIEEQIKEYQIELPPFLPPERGDLFEVELENSRSDIVAGLNSKLEHIESDITRHLNFKIDNSIQMNELQERLHVLELVSKLFNESLRNEKEDDKEDEQIDLSSIDENPDEPLLSLPDIEIGASSNYMSPTQSIDRHLRKLAGVIPSGKQFAFERQLFRISRGKILIRMSEIEEPLLDQTTQKPVAKIAFCVYFIGSHLQKKIQKLCDTSQATIYPICAPQIIPTESMRLKLILHEKSEIARRTTNNIFSILKHVSGNNEHVALAPLRQWQVALRREFTLCETLRYAANDISFVHIEGWCMVSDVYKLRPAFEDVTQALGQHSVGVFIEHTDSQPPTFFKTSPLTRPFQLLVDTYGVPRYLEINPALFSIIMYPFLFGIMYGDIFHGSALLAIAIYLCIREKNLQQQKREGKLGEIFGMAFGGRYVLLLMGIFAVFCGFIYNDFASLPIHLFESGWVKEDQGNYTMIGVYPFGVDSEWHGKKNTMHFYNSLKMKISIIVGVIQMIIGICLKGLNDAYFKDWLGFFFEFIPELLFMICTFGYMTFLILYKWTVESPSPNLIQTELNMFMSPGNVSSEFYLYPGQVGLQTFCFLIVALSLPVMLLGKPLMILRARRKKISPLGFSYDLLTDSDNIIPDQESVGLTEISADNEDSLLLHESSLSSSFSSNSDKKPNTLSNSLQNSMYKISEKENDLSTSVGSIVTSSQNLEEIQKLQSHSSGDKNASLSELFIFQGIHTIEFVLGSISNTASYLRLWALSLAHSELAEVFWSKVFMVGVSSNNPIAIIIAFGAWAGATMFALILMDILECILHALRLQWVEFQNKFFHADGYPFEPFSFYIKDDF